MIIEISLVGRSKSNGIVESAIQSVKGLIRTIRSAIEENGRWRLMWHSVWPWIAENAGFLMARFEVAAKPRMSD